MFWPTQALNKIIIITNLIHTSIALLPVTVSITLLIRIVIPPVAFLVFIILILIYFLFMNHEVGHLRQTICLSVSFISCLFIIGFTVLREMI